MKTSVLIPARLGSKGLERKNLQKIGDKSLIEISIIQAKHIFGKNIDVYVSTESKKISQHCKGKAKIISRPNKLATDKAKTIDVIKHAIDHIDSDYVCLLQVTNPFRDISKIKKALKKFYKGGYECGFSAYDFHGFMYKENGKPINRSWRKRPRRQDSKNMLIEDGAFYIFNRNVINKKDFIWKGAYIFPGFNGIDIHDKEDLQYANILWSKNWLR